MTEQAAVVTDRGAAAAVQPPATEVKPDAAGAVTPPEKTQEQLAAEKVAADEAKAKQDEADAAEEATIKKKPWFQKRFDELTRQREEERRRADRLENILQRTLEVVQKPIPAQESPKPAEFQPTRPMPTRESVQFDEDKFVAETVKWHLDQERARADIDRRATEQKTAVQTFQTEFETRKVSMLKTGIEKYPDFETTIGSIPAQVFNPEMAVAVLETGQPAEIAYHLAKNPAEAERISKLPPIRKAIELGKIEARLSASPAPKPPAAPAPIVPVGGKVPGTVKEDELSMDEWLKRRNAGQITGHG